MIIIGYLERANGPNSIDVCGVKHTKMLRPTCPVKSINMSKEMKRKLAQSEASHAMTFAAGLRNLKTDMQMTRLTMKTASRINARNRSESQDAID